MTPLRILHVEEFFHGRRGYQVNILSKYHRRHGHDVEIVTTDRTSPWPESSEAIVGADAMFTDATGVTVTRIRAGLDVRRRTLMPGLAGVVRRRRPDVLFLHGVATLKDRLLMGSRRAPCVVIDAHALDEATTLSPLVRDAARGLARPFLRALLGRGTLDAAYALGSDEARWMRAVGVPPDLIRLAPHSVDLEVMRFDPWGRRRIRADLAVGDDDVLLLSPGRLDVRKDPARLLRVLGEGLAGRPGSHLVLMGPSDPAYMSREVDPLRAALPPGVRERVHVLPAVPHANLASWYSAADLVAWPEESTLSALDALACGRPVVMADYPANRERVGEGGLLARPRDDDALARALTSLLDDRNERTRRGEAGRVRVRRDFDYQALAARLEAEWTAIIERQVTD